MLDKWRVDQHVVPKLSFEQGMGDLLHILSLAPKNTIGIQIFTNYLFNKSMFVQYHYKTFFPLDDDLKY